MNYAAGQGHPTGEMPPPAYENYQHPRGGPPPFQPQYAQPYPQPYYYPPPPPMQQMQSTNNVIVVNQGGPATNTLIVQRRGVNHCLHCVISVIFFPWIIVWIILCIID